MWYTLSIFAERDFLTGGILVVKIEELAIANLDNLIKAIESENSVDFLTIGNREIDRGIE